MIAATASNPSSKGTLALLQVSLAHEYFDGTAFGFKVFPLPATDGLCRRLGLRIGRDGGTLTVYATAGILAKLSSADYRAALAAATLCWQITPDDPEFSAFTGLDFVSATQCLILTNDATGAQGGALTAGPFASRKDVWMRRPPRFDFTPARPLRAGTELAIENVLGEPLAEIEVIDPWCVAVDTGGFGSGLYRLTANGSVLATWFADERGAVLPAPGSILILPGRLLAAAFSNALGNMLAVPALPVYTATYPARAVIWRYHVFNAEAGEELSIVPYEDEMPSPADGKIHSRRRRRATATGKPQAAFLPVADPTLPTARSFEAAKPLKLAQRAPQRFALNSGAVARFAPLPLAGCAFGRSGRGAAPCSEIFVYL